MPVVGNICLGLKRLCCISAGTGTYEVSQLTRPASGWTSYAFRSIGKPEIFFYGLGSAAKEFIDGNQQRGETCILQSSVPAM
jgi:hypothetical protein